MRHVRLKIVTPILFFFMGSAHADLIQNGGFEDPDIATGSWSVFGAIPGWRLVFGTGIEIQDHVAGSPFEGGQFVELDSHNNSGIAQDIATSSGGTYLLSFAFSARPGVSVMSNGVSIFWNGAFLDFITASGTGLLDTNWTTHDYEVSATGGLTSLEFHSAGISDSLGGYIDGVSLVAAVPEPGTLALLGIGLLGLGFTKRKRMI